MQLMRRTDCCGSSLGATAGFDSIVFPSFDTIHLPRFSMTIHHLRRTYQAGELLEENASADPFDQFRLCLKKPKIWRLPHGLKSMP